MGTEPSTPSPTAGDGLPVVMVKIADIKIGARVRKDLGDLTELAKSIETLGLLNPVTITTDYLLAAGERRLAAVKQLGWTEVPARLLNPEQLLRSEHDENVLRQDFSPSELVAIAELLWPAERAAARQRKAAGQVLGGHEKNARLLPRTVEGEQTTNSSRPRHPDSSERVAKAVGWSGNTLLHAKAVIDAAANDPSLQRLVDQMDKSGKVKPAYDELQRLRPSAGTTAAAPKPRGLRVTRPTGLLWRKNFQRWVRRAKGGADLQILHSLDREIHMNIYRLGSMPVELEQLKRRYEEGQDTQ